MKTEKLLANDDCRSLWADTTPAAPALAALAGEHTASVAVVGGGYTGLSAALHLAEAGTDVALLEAREIGYGGAGRNVGLVNAGLWMLPEDIVAAGGPEYGERLLTTLGASPDLVFGLIEKHGIDCEAVRAGTLHCAHSPGGYRVLRRREAQWRDRGAPVTLLSPEQAAPMIGSTAFHGALLDRRAGTVQPLAYAFGLARAAMAAGAKIFTGSPVTAMNRSGSRWRLETPSGTLTADAVIVAVHGYPQGAFSGHRDKFIDFNFFQFATPPLPEAVKRTILPGGHGAWDTALVLSSYRVDKAGRLIVGSVGRTDGWALHLNRGWAERVVRKVFPQVGPTAFAHSWWGRIAMTDDHIPRLHHLGPGAVAVASFNGRGIGPGTLMGKLLSQYVLTGDDSALPLPFSPPVPIFMKTAKDLFYETGARLTHTVGRRWPMVPPGAPDTGRRGS